MTAYRDPKTHYRIAVLRPQNPTLALERLAEWNRLMDKVADAEASERAPERREAQELWLTMKREQQWAFMGWLGKDAKTLENGDPALPGDLHENEDRMKNWGLG